MTDAEYDVIIIGAGPVGENVADRVVQGGLTAAIVESELVGGECSYWACMPTKALLRDAAAFRSSQQLPGAAAAMTGDLDANAVLARRDRFASNWQDDGQVTWLNEAGITLVRGHGSLTAPRAVSVTGADGSVIQLNARHAVVIATGTSAVLPPIPGLADAKPWTSREAVSASTIPDRLAIIGGGVVGAEMATAFNALGSAVTVIARDGVLPNVEPYAAEHVIAYAPGHDSTVSRSSSLAHVWASGPKVPPRNRVACGSIASRQAFRLPRTTTTTTQLCR